MSGIVFGLIAIFAALVGFHGEPSWLLAFGCLVTGLNAGIYLQRKKLYGSVPERTQDEQ